MRRQTKSGPLSPGTFNKLALAVIVLLYCLEWWKQQPVETQGETAIVVTLILSGLAVGRLYREHKHQKMWRQALTDDRIIPSVTKQEEVSPLKQLTAIELESFAALLFKAMGYHVRLTKRTADHGVDVVLINTQGDFELVQCKQWSKPVGEPQIRDFYGTLHHAEALQGWILAPGGFTNAARQWANGKPIHLLDEVAIARLVKEVYRH